MNPVLSNIQVLRGIAAMMVVAYHASGNVVEWRGGTSWEAGQAGVDIFFVISGLVMALSAKKAENRNWRAFALRRLARIVPMYWLATSVKFAAVLAGAYMAASAIDWQHALSSYLFMPHRWGDGGIYPLLYVGWTLNFEVFFYLLFTIGLALRMSVVRFLSAAIIILAVVGIYRPGDWPDVTTLFHPILFEFLLGVWIGQYLKSDFRLPASIAIPLMAACMLMICIAPVDMDVSWSRVVWWGLPSAVLVATAAHFESAPQRLWIKLGDASYATYLWHGFIISAMAKALGMLPPSLPGGLLWLAATVTACGMGGYLIHLWVEQPMTQYFKVRVDRILGKKKPLVPVAVVPTNA